MQDPVSKPPIFVLCTARSGSTLLRYILDTHPKVCCPPELHLVTLMQRLLWVHSNTSNARIQGDNEAAVQQEAAQSTRKNIYKIMDDYTISNGKLIWCEKSIYSIDLIDLILSVFPDARFLCLYRNCADVVNSSLETLKMDSTGRQYGFASYLARHPASHLHAMVACWMDKTVRTMKFEKSGRAPCYRLRYEDIVQRPTEVLSAMFAFLGLGWSQNLTDSVFTNPHTAGPGDHKILQTLNFNTDNMGKGTHLGATPLPTDMKANLNKILAILKYPPWG